MNTCQKCGALVQNPGDSLCKECVIAAMKRIEHPVDGGYHFHAQCGKPPS